MEKEDRHDNENAVYSLYVHTEPYYSLFGI
jgi:hypothetical protein